ncbi:MAG: transporter [Myxococcota bacterium]
MATVTLAVGLFATPVLAEEARPSPPPPDGFDDTISTDRPGNANAASVVGVGRANIESSVAVAYDDIAEGPDAVLVTFPVSMRVGMLAPFELRFGGGLVGIDANAPDGETSAAPTDLFVGGKVQMSSAEGARPSSAISFDVNLPTGEGAFTAGIPALDARALVAWQLPAGFGLLLNAGVATVPVDETRAAQALYSGFLSYAIPGLRERLGLFVEGFGRVGIRDGGDPQAHIFDWGAWWLFTPDAQIDFFIQHGLNDDATDLQAAIGFSGRIR